MILKQYDAIFLHPNKCAGKSIEWVLGGKHPAPGSSDHLTLRGYISRHPKEAKEYFKFSFCRNPWDRMVSIYFGRTQLYGHKEGSFKDFVKRANPEKNPTQRQLNWMLDFEDKMAVDYIGRVETIQHDWQVICNKLNIFDMKLPHLNKSNHKHYTYYYDDEARSIVEDKYAADIKYFGYEFEED